ncbi:MAG: endonuclease [Candidatus Micrarchaeota archaeon]
MFKTTGWWPAADLPNEKAVYKKRKKLKEFQKFEICVGAILTQNTSWKNAEKSIENLKQQKLFSLEKISHAKPGTIARAIRSSGYYNQKTKKIQAFCRHVLKNHKTIARFLKQPAKKLRSELLSLHGIGPETADSIILYASNQPVFVVDAYTRRFVERFWNKKLDYKKAQESFETQLPKNAELFNEYHALLVEHAKRFCASKPNCTDCFLGKKCGNPKTRKNP